METLNIDFEFVVWDNKRAERNPATDAAVVVVYNKGSLLQPLILYELNSSVHPSNEKVEKGVSVNIIVQILLGALQTQRHGIILRLLLLEITL